MSLFGQRDEFSASNPDPLTPEEHQVLDKLAAQVIKRGMAVPAIMFLESVKPLNYVSSQAMIFFEPIVQTIFNFKDFDTFRTALEKRPTLELLIQKIEAQDAVAYKHEKAVRAFVKAEKKKWKWYQRWLGIATPRIELPDDPATPNKPAS